MSDYGRIYESITCNMNQLRDIENTLVLSAPALGLEDAPQFMLLIDDIYRHHFELQRALLAESED